MIGSAICEKFGFELIELEDAVKEDGGCWLKFIKVPNTNPGQAQAAAGKGAPPKGKGAPVDDLKPTFSKAWMDLSELRKPGSTSTTVRVHLETCASCTKEADSDKYVDNEEITQVFEAERTYVHLTVSISKPIISLEST